MRVDPNVFKKSVDLRELTFHETQALHLALQHEMVRSQRRADDERLSAETRNLEARHKNAVNRVLDAMGPCQAIWSKVD